MTALSVLPSESHPWIGLFDRPDIMIAQGMLHLVHEDLAPDAAMTADLLLVADALEARGIPILLIRHGRSTPALVVDTARAADVHRALQAVAVDEPLYVKTKGGTPVPVPHWSEPAGIGAVRVFRPRTTPDGALRYGSRTAARVEFWRFGTDTVEAPQANALTRRVIATDDLAYTTAERFGRSWPTIAGMFQAHAGEFTGDVDMVFSWVDGSSSDFQRQRAAQQAEYVVGDGDDGPARYRHVDELRYALRSVHMYAPWVRRIFIATDSPRPDWLADHPKVTIVGSEEFFADPSVLPTHNSHAVESQLHRIEGLSEHFLYSNDDMFFGRRVEPELFFSPGGVTRFVECDVRIGPGPARVERSGHDNALRRNRALIQERFGSLVTMDLAHCATPLRRSVMAELEREFADEIARTAASRFRAATDVSVTNCLYHYYAQETGRAIATTTPRVRYVQTTLASSLQTMHRLAERPDCDMFCFNDGGESEVPEPVRVQALRDALARMFPVRAPWERPVVSAAQAGVPSAERYGN